MKAFVAIIAIIFYPILMWSQSLPQGKRHNKIDDIRTTSEIQELLTKLNPNDSKFVIPDTISTQYQSKKKCQRIMDSVGAKIWVKADLDGNGYTDMLVSGIKGDDFRAYCIMDSSSNHFYTVPLTTLAFQPVTYSVIKMKDDQCVILYYSTRDKHSWYDTSETLHIDTLIFRKGHLTELNEKPEKHQISEIHFGSESVWGSSRFIDFDINGPVSCDLYNTPSGRSLFSEVQDLLNYSGFTRLDTFYTVQWTDDATAHLRIIYDNGTIKQIEDYGLQGSFGLMHIYDVLLSTEQKCKKGPK